MINLIAPKNFEQAACLKYFLETANLVKIATVWLGLNPVQQQVYVRRVLKQCANIYETPCNPLSKFYAQLLIVRSLRALINQQTLLINL